jgi:hypothetical protein
LPLAFSSFKSFSNSAKSSSSFLFNLKDQQKLLT